jgi:hypothetical protein
LTADTWRQIKADYLSRSGRIGVEIARTKSLPDSEFRTQRLAALTAEQDRCNLIVSQVSVEIQRAETSTPTLFNAVDALRQ